MNRSHFLATSEGIGANRGNTVGQVNALQFMAVKERKLTDAGEFARRITRERHQFVALHESLFAYFLHLNGEAHATHA